MSLCISKNAFDIFTLEKLFDVASECHDSIDFDRDKNSHIWTPNPHLL